MLHKTGGKSIGDGRERGFTLIELLVVIAIIAILAAILFPVFTKAKVSANRAACLGHLKQLGAALNLYQQNYSGCYPSTVDYANDGDPTPQLPWGHATWAKRLADGYTKSINVFRCPGAANPLEVPTIDGSKVELCYSYNEYIWYGIRWNYPFYKESAMRSPKHVLLLADGHNHSLVHDWDTNESECELTTWAKLEGLPEGMLRVKYADGILKEGVRMAPRERHRGSNVLFADLHAKTLLKGQYKWANEYRMFPVIYPGAQPYF